MCSQASMASAISRSLHTTLRRMGWSNGIITMSGRPLSKVPWEERFAGQQQLTLCSELSMLLSSNPLDSCHTLWYMASSSFSLLIYPRQCSLFLCQILMTLLPLSWSLGKLVNYKSVGVTILFPHRSTLLFIHSRCLLTWRGRRHSYINTSYLLILTSSSFCFLNLSMDIANS